MGPKGPIHTHFFGKAAMGRPPRHVKCFPAFSCSRRSSYANTAKKYVLEKRSLCITPPPGMSSTILRVLVGSEGNGFILADDVKQVAFADANHGTVTTTSGKTWVTVDGGETWEIR
jgi:hypothetical protein